MSSYTSYVSGMDAAIHFDSSNNIDITTIEYTYSKNNLPIYGYKSFEWNDVLEGEEVIQGTFGLNFKQSLQLHEYVSNDKSPFDLKNLPINRSSQAGTSMYLNNKEGKELAVNLSNNITKKIFMIFIKYKVIKPLLLEENGKPVYKDVTFKKGVTLTGVRINSVQQAIAADASPIGEYYTFIGRSAVEHEETPFYYDNNHNMITV